jgi:hypothetical protein
MMCVKCRLPWAANRRLGDPKTARKALRNGSAAAAAASD